MGRVGGKWGYPLYLTARVGQQVGQLRRYVR